MKIYHSDLNSIDFDPIDIKEIIKENVSYKRDLIEQTKELKKIKTRLERINERFFNVFKGLHLAAFIFRKIGDKYYLVDFNKKSSEIDNLTENDKGKTICEIYPNIKEFGIIDVFDKVFENGEPEKHHSVYNYDGIRKGIRNSYIYKLTNNRNEIMGVYEDISHIVQIEDTFNVIFNLSECPMCILTLKDYIIKDANKSFFKYIGYNRKEIINYPIFKRNIIYEIDKKIKKEIGKKGEIERVLITMSGKDDKFLEGYISAKFIMLKNIRYLLVIVLPKCKE